MELFDQLQGRCEEVIAYRGGCPVTGGQFMEQALALAPRLPGRGVAVNLCRDRYWFSVAVAAAALRGHTTVLPPSQAAAAVERVSREHDSPYYVGDGGREPPSPLYRVDRLAEPGGGEPVRESRDGPDVVIYTSGSTGTPSAHPKYWRGLFAGNRLLAERLGLSGAQPASVIATVPPQHMFGLETTVLLPFSAKVAVFAGRPFFPADVREALQACPPPRVLVSTPVHLEALARAGADWPALALVLSSTAPLGSELAGRLESGFACPVVEIYGSTETGAIATRRQPADEDWRLMDGMRLQREADRCVLHGPQLEAPHPLQDLIEVVGEGRFRCHGRPEDMVKIAGKRASLSELTLRLNAVSGVVDGAFVVDETYRRGLGAVVVAPGAVTDAQIREQLLREFDPVFVPRRFCRIAAIPRNETGKIPRQWLLETVRKARGR